MKTQHLARLVHVPDHQLIDRVFHLRRRSCQTDADLVAHVYEMRRRKLHVDAGYSSMYEYCLRALRMSEGQAVRLLSAVDIARIEPRVLDMIRNNEVHLTGLAKLKPYINPGNAPELLALARHQSKRAIEEALARRFPRRAPKDEVRTVRARALPLMLSTPTSVQSTPAEHGADSNHALGVLAEARREACLETLAPRDPPSYTQPLAEDVYKVTFGASRRFMDKLSWAADLMRHTCPDGDLETVIEAALDALLEQRLAKKFAQVKHPRREGKDAKSSKSIPARVKRGVVDRDGYRCTFESAAGYRCECRAFLEFDHIKPVALGGDHSMGNIRILCRTHNQRAADESFGEEFMNEMRYALSEDELDGTAGQVKEGGFACSYRRRYGDAACVELDDCAPGGASNEVDLPRPRPRPQVIDAEPMGHQLRLRLHVALAKEARGGWAR